MTGLFIQTIVAGLLILAALYAAYRFIKEDGRG